MSSGFVSGGTIDKPVERDEEWKRAEQALEDERKRKAEIEKAHGGKSLFEVLQANKAAKQEAFEEAAKLKNQFRSLDDDEIDFLDSVREAERTKETTVRKETSEQLAAFRKQQDEIERKAKLEAGKPEDAGKTEVTQWTIGKKRKKEKEGFKGLLKQRKTESEKDAQKQVDNKPAKSGNTDKATEKKIQAPPVVEKTKAASPPKANTTAAPMAGLGLVAYGSDDSD